MKVNKKIKASYLKIIKNTLTDILLFSKREEYKKQHQSFNSDLLDKVQKDVNNLYEFYKNGLNIDCTDQLLDKYSLENNEKKNLSIIEDHVKHLFAIEKNRSGKVAIKKYIEMKNLHTLYRNLIKNYLFPPIDFNIRQLMGFVVYIPSVLIFNGFFSAIIICWKLKANFNSIFIIGDLINLSIGLLADRLILYFVYFALMFFVIKSKDRADYRFIGTLKSHNFFINISLITALLSYSILTALSYTDGKDLFVFNLIILSCVFIIFILHNINGIFINITRKQYIAFVCFIGILSVTTLDSIDVFRNDNKITVRLDGNIVLDNYLLTTSRYIIFKENDHIKLYPVSEIKEIIINQ